MGSTRKTSMNKARPSTVKGIHRNPPALAGVRLGCLCKSWCDLIKSPNFISLHLNRRAEYGERLLLKSKSYIGNDDESRTRFHIHSNMESVRQVHVAPPDLHDLPFSEHGYWVNFKCHCDGLVYLNDDYHMLNTAMRQFRLLPQLQPPLPDLFPKEKYDGFGYDPNTNDY
ncbi:hypothetical protein ACH5RR_019122 [Cinchona calisaya]|uniref:F-box protein n=1 Tax=Cinchona calisaya TaxID=153742 RepID=A0ABD2ZPR1_9GENT